MKDMPNKRKASGLAADIAEAISARESSGKRPKISLENLAKELADRRDRIRAEEGNS